MTRSRALLVLALVGATLPAIGVWQPWAGAAAASTQPGFVDEAVFTGLQEPTAMRFSPDGRVFVAEKSGLVKVFASLSASTPTVFADLRTNVYNFWDRGLLGLELHPNFPATPYVYVLYALDAPIGGATPRWGTAGATSDPCPSPPGPTSDGCVIGGRLSRLTASGNVMTGSEQVLVEDWCQQYPSHSVGSLGFGADGKLYASAGEGSSFTFTDYGQDGNPVNPCNDPGGTSPTPPTAEGGSLRSQDIRTLGDPVGLSGSVIRIDPVTGAGLADNPMGSSSDPNARRIVATGLRNPFRFAVRPGTSELWVGDVGLSSWEEIDVVANPTDGSIDNFGWPCYEGSSRHNGFDALDVSICEQLYAQPGAVTDPYFAYSHHAPIVGEDCAPGSSAIAGITFAPVSGGSYPASFSGAAFFADNARDCIWVMKTDPSGRPVPNRVEPFVAGAANPVDVRIGPDGMLYYVDFDGGQVRRVRYVGDATPPVVSGVTPGAGATGVDVDANVVVSFSEPMDASTVSTSTVALRSGNASGPVVATTVTYDAATRAAVLDPVTALPAGATFSVLVKGGASGVKDVAGNPLASDQVSSFSTTGAVGSVQFVSDLAFVGSPTNGWGPIERDRSNGEEGATDGVPMRIGTETFSKGLGVHASSDARFTVPNGCTRFQAKVGIDEETGVLGTVTFQVFAGTTQLGATVARNGTQSSASVDVDVTGRSDIRLVVGPGSDNIDDDHADWGDAKFICGTPGDTTAPSVVAMTPTSGATQIGVDANVIAMFSEPMDAATVNTSTVALRAGNASGPVVAASIAYDAPTRTAIIDPVAALAGASTFTVVIKGGTAGVKDVAGNPLAVDVLSSFTTAAAASNVQFLSDLPFIGTPTNGWGPIERDRSNGEQGATDGVPMRIGTEAFAKGLGAHAASDARFAVPAGCTRLQARVGIDEESGALGTVTFQVFAGTTQLGATVARNGTQSSASVDVDVTGRSDIRLVVGPGSDNIDNDHADWGDAKFLCGAPASPNAPQPVIVTPDASTAWSVGDVITFSGTATDVEDGVLSASALSWSLVLQHCPSSCHSHVIQSFPSVAGGSFTAPDHEYPAFLELRLTATDSSGLTTTVVRRLDPRTVDLVLASVPPGLQLVVDDATATTPFTRTVIAGSSHSVSAATPQVVGSTTYEFVSWSDGGARSHQVVASSSMMLTASYRDVSTPVVKYLSDLAFVGSPTNGWGPIERDRSNGEQGATDGVQMRIGTETFAKGLGTHASSEARFAVPAGCTRLQARVGIDEESGALGTVTFQVFAGTTQLGASVDRNGTQPSALIDIDVSGRSEVRLVVGPGSDNIDDDHADWGDAKFLC